MSKHFIDKEAVDRIEAIEEAEAHGCGYRDVPIQKIPGGGMICKRVYEPVRPLPCVRDEHGEIREQTVKQLLAKIDEELNELKAGVLSILNLDDISTETPTGVFPFIAEEAADTITAITTMLEALGIDADMRDDAQRRVNKKNKERGRL